MNNGQNGMLARNQPWFSLFHGLTPEDDDRYQQMIQNVATIPRLVWYPSAGTDFKDFRLFNHNQEATSGCIQPPDLFIHTDYACESLFELTPRIIDSGRLSSERYGDDRVTVNVLRACSLVPALGLGDSYFVDPELVMEPGYAAKESVIRLYEVGYQTSGLEPTYEGTALLMYAYWENINFMTTFFTATNSPVEGIFQGDNDGCGLGAGGQLSMTVLFPFLRTLGVKVLNTCRPDGHQYSYNRSFDWVEEIAGRTGWKPQLFIPKPILSQARTILTSYKVLNWIIEPCDDRWSPDALVKIWENALKLAEKEKKKKVISRPYSIRRSLGEGFQAG